LKATTPQLARYGKMTAELKPCVSHDALVLVGDGQKALFLRNRGTGQRVELELERILEQDNPPTREQGSDRPGRSAASVGVARSAMDEANWHHLAKERFASEIAKALYRRAHDNRFTKLVIVAPPRILGNLRKEFHPEVIDRIIGEIPKELTSHSVAQIEKLIAT
jgi:protein required for attachment to host cells